LLIDLGLGYLSVARSSTSLSGGEAQRIRLAIQTMGNLHNILYVLDEPSIGLHPAHNRVMLKNLYNLKEKGNSLIVVEHDEDFIRNSEYLIDIGPEAGENGGRVLYEGATEDFLNSKQMGHTWNNFSNPANLLNLSKHRKVIDKLQIMEAEHNNLKKIDVNFALNCLNVVIGVSGAGKSSLVEEILARYMRKRLHNGKEFPGSFSQVLGAEKLNMLIDINQAPIGKTPRSNVATYTKMFDQIRQLFANQALAKKQGWKSNRFSFNSTGGRCEKCKGAGVNEIGMHLFANIETTCEVCEGKRFTKETLKVKYKSKNIFQVLELSVDDAIDFFREEPKILRFLFALQDVGLGYIKLGQPSTTFSGGEAQRIKLATHLAKPNKKQTLYILDEPTTGLSIFDVKHLLAALQKLVEQGNTVIIIEHHPHIVFSADYLLELGPESGEKGGEIVFNGNSQQFREYNNSIYLKALADSANFIVPTSKPIPSALELSNVKTNNLKNLSVKIPHNKLTVITGVSGSGKSSLAFDTIFAEAHTRFTENLSAFARRFMKNIPQPEFESVCGLTPVIAISQHKRFKNPHSTVGTFTNISDLLRLLFARISSSKTYSVTPLAQDFSRNHQAGACGKCNGIGEKLLPDIDKIITNPSKSLLDGAMDGTKTGKFYGDIYGQYVAIIKAVGDAHNIDFSLSWNDLSSAEKRIAMFGTEAEEFDVVWNFKRKQRAGEHKFRTIWHGFANYIAEEFARKQHTTRSKTMLSLMTLAPCVKCKGTGLNEKALSYQISNLNIADISSLSMIMLRDLLTDSGDLNLSNTEQEVYDFLGNKIVEKIVAIEQIGLSYLSLDRKLDTLSGGELQRLKLINHLIEGLRGITFVLDEPTIGLHPTDTKNLLGILQKLLKNGNTVIVVEHDREMILNADNILDIGPGAGRLGGELIHSGDVESLLKNPASDTAKYLKSKNIKKIRRSKEKSDKLSIIGAKANNLKKLNLEISNKKITAITGVSGSGKSSLLIDVIFKYSQAGLSKNVQNIFGLENFNKIVLIDQRSLPNSSVSTVATYTKIFDKIRKEFSFTKLSQQKKLKADRFSYLNKASQCPICKGLGKKKISMDFMGDVWLECEACAGKRYNEQILEVELNEKNISEVLALEINESVKYF
ncbi:MAG: ATP-binding cassette domain-containing protein, partial [Candidatus Cloacimonetes bacterium]|nr:ATP-binding cassette domain-containing protein [Candidatus Cloacimonadota bacterium]